MNLVKLYTATFILIFVLGCAVASDRPSPKINFNDIHAANFSPLSRFYCEKGRWPNDMDEIIGYAQDRNMVAPLGFYQDAHFSVPREVELFILYNTRSTGIESKEAVSFKAPPCDSGEQSGMVNLAAGQVSFPLPDGFRMLSIEDIEQRYAQPPYPDFVYLHDLSDALISLRFGNVAYENDNAQVKLNELVNTYSNTTPGITWRNKEIIYKAGQPWIRLAMEGDSDIGRLYTEMLFTSFKGKVFSLYFVTPVENFKKVVGSFKETFDALAFNPKNETVLVEDISNLETRNRAAVAIERINQGSIRLRDVLINYPSDSWEIAKEEESRGIPSVDFVYKSSEGMLKATIQVLPSVVKEDSYLEIVTKNMQTIYKDMKSSPITTKSYSGYKFRCRQNEAMLKDQLPFMIETCLASTRLKSVMIILGGSLNLFSKNISEYNRLLSSLNLGS